MQPNNFIYLKYNQIHLNNIITLIFLVSNTHEWRVYPFSQWVSESLVHSFIHSLLRRHFANLYAFVIYSPHFHINKFAFKLHHHHPSNQTANQIRSPYKSDVMTEYLEFSWISLRCKWKLEIFGVKVRKTDLHTKATIFTKRNIS